MEYHDLMTLSCDLVFNNYVVSRSNFKIMDEIDVSIVDALTLLAAWGCVADDG